jgi:hypothetical protein
MVSAEHGGPPQRVEGPLRPAGLERQLPDVRHRPAAHGQSGHVLPPQPGPHRHRQRVCALTGEGWGVFTLLPIGRLFLPSRTAVCLLKGSLVKKTRNVACGFVSEVAKT